MKLIASARMLKAQIDLRRKGKILSGPIMPRREDATSNEELNRVIKARLAIQGAPLLYRPEPALSNYNDPTPQWQAKAGTALAKDTIGKGEIVPVKRYRIKHVLESHGDKLDMDMRSALERFMQDSVYASRISVSDPNRGGGFSSPGMRLGGLGGLPQHIRDGHARYEWAWARLNPKMQAVASALVLRELAKPDGTPFSLEDFGAKMFPQVADKNRRWGAAAGALWSLGADLAWLYSQCPIRVRRVDEEELRLERAG